MRRLHNFMDKMRDKSLEERRKILFFSTTFLGAFVALIGLWNISSNLISLNDTPSNLASVTEEKTVSKLSNVASVWSLVKNSLQSLNDRLGTEKANQ